MIVVHETDMINAVYHTSKRWGDELIRPLLEQVFEGEENASTVIDEILDAGEFNGDVWTSTSDEFRGQYRRLHVPLIEI